MASAIHDIVLREGAKMPALGLGTWRMGERASARAAEVAALQLGVSLGIRLIDTAEMYGEGKAEERVAEVIAGRRDRIFLVSKVYPHNASRRGAIAACEGSLKRLRTDYLDLYLLHWRGDVPLAQTVAAFEALRGDGRIRAWGASNFDARDMQELLALPGGRHCAANQVLYHLGCRGVEWELLPLCRRQGIAVMAYSPLGQGRLLRERELHSVATRAGATPAQVALAWLLAQPGVAAIPKATDLEHVRENRAAGDLRLTPNALAELERAFPGPSKATPLAML